MNAKTLRRKFIQFFTQSPRFHQEIPSSSLLPENDPTVLFITAGMHPLVPYLLGEPHPLGKRLVDIQRCMRTDDIEAVGDLSHFTFFEMLGNWSLGDYFKKEAIRWSFEFLTEKKWLGLSPTRIYVSVFAGDQDAPPDQESILHWQKVFQEAGIKAEVGSAAEGIKGKARIFPYPKNKNWWGPAGKTGPCGPDTEMFYDTGLPLHQEKIHGKICHPNCDCGRFIEVWNDVFMEYNKQSDGRFLPLKQKNVDTGMGLERVTAILEWLAGEISQPDPFQTELFFLPLKKLQVLSGKPYRDFWQKPFRIILDHLRAAVFLLADGILPGNKEQGYVLRRLIRRSVRYGQILGIKNNFLSLLAQDFFPIYQDEYPHLLTQKKIIEEELETEERKFQKTLKRGLSEIARFPKLDGKIAFYLYQSFGFPWEMTAEIAKEKGQKIEEKAFLAEFKKHQELSRTATQGRFKGGLQDASEETTRLHTATHLLQQALREVLGKHVHQKGSHITSTRLRFDFSHPKKLTTFEKRKIEKLVNQKIKENLPVFMQVKTLKEAEKEGALTIPGLKYPEKVKVYSIGNFSQEVCGGPHVDFTGKLGKFKIIKEEALGNQVRRIYAILSN